MSTVLIPDIGLNGLVNSVRRLTGLTNPGYRDVESSAEFIAGMVCTLDATTGKLVVADNTDTEVLGLFYCHKTISFYRPVQDEEHTFGTAPNTSTIVYLNNAYLKAGSVLVTSTGGVVVADSGNWSVNTTNGTITRNPSGSIAADATINISYLYQDSNLVGIDQTMGSGKAATLEDSGEVATLVYDTSVTYTVMGSVYVTSDGYITSTAGAKAIGIVTKAPSSEDPEIHFKLQLS